MRILLTNLSMEKPGGTELWTRTIYKQMISMGYDVDIYTRKTGSFLNFYNKENTFSNKYDLIMGNHLKVFPELLSTVVKTPTIYTKHSFFLDIEKYIDISDKYVAVSQEIADTEKTYNPQVILNPIDTDIYCSYKISNTLKTVGYLSHDGGLGDEVIKGACNTYGVRYLKLEHGDNVSDFILNCDLCIGIGRMLIEAMACGRNVISADHRWWMDDFSGAGRITPDNFLSLQYDNYSGRTNKIRMNEDRLIEYFGMYDKNIGVELESLVYQYHNAKKIVEQYLELWTSIKKDI